MVPAVGRYGNGCTVMGGYHVVPDTNPLGDTTPLPLFNVHWIVVNRELWNDCLELDLIVAATNGEEAIAKAIERFPHHEHRHWGYDPIRFDKGVCVL